MTISVKICGISTEEALEAAIEGGADYAGFVFFKRSPRHLTLARAAKLVQKARGRIKTVALTVNARDSTIRSIMTKVRPDFLQLHGDENPDRVAAIRQLSRALIVKAIKVGSPNDIESAGVFEPLADHLLFDAQAASLPDALPGGNGVAFDWGWLAEGRPRPKFMLSGGLNSDNVLAALGASGASAVDVSSGVETSPGRKDPSLIRNFIKTAKSFEPAPSAKRAARKRKVHVAHS
jgi:phosphoribosylanthranilate isomerase